MFWVVVWPSIGGPIDQEIQFFIRVIAFPVPAVIGEEISMAADPNAIKRIANTTGKDTVLSGGRIDPKQGGVALIGFIANVAR